MIAIVGVDTDRDSNVAIRLLGKFQFEKPEITLAHFVRPVPAYYPFTGSESIQIQSDLLKVQESQGREALDEADAEATRDGLRADRFLGSGPAAEGLIDLAEQIHADVVAVQAKHESMWSNTFLGSVSRGLAIGSRASVLVSKGQTRSGTPLKIVLATDHSEESTRWIDRFLSWRPNGISDVLVVTAYELEEREASILYANLPALRGTANAWIEEHLNLLNEKLKAKLTAAGMNATVRVAEGSPNDAIRRAMQDSQSDVLVMGAQGHGFLERLFIGSCAMHQVVAEAYPVLVVRGS